MRILMMIFVIALAWPAAAQQGLAPTTRASLRRRAESALQILRREVPTLRVSWRADRVQPTVLRRLALVLPGPTLEKRARAFFDRYPGLVGQDSRALVLRDQRRAVGRRVLRFEQRLEGVPVDGSLLTMAFDDGGRLLVVHIDTRPLPSLDTHPRIDTRQAVAATWQAVGRRPARPLEARRLKGVSAKLLVQALPNQARLVYRVVLPLSLDPAGRLHFVDAHDGRYLGWRAGVLWHRPRTARAAGVRR